MASHTLRTEKFPAAQSVGVYLRTQRFVLDAAPSGSAIATATVAADSSLTFTGLLDGTAYTAYASISSTPTYVDFTTENPRLASTGAGDKNEPLEDARRRNWQPGSATMARADATGNTAAPTSGTLLLAGGVILARGKQYTSIGFVSGTTAGGTLTHQEFCIVRQSDKARLAVTADDTSTAWGADAPKELLLASPYTPSDDVAVYLGLVVTASAVPTLTGSIMKSTALGGALGGAPAIAATGDASLTDPASIPATIGTLTAVVGLPYAWVR